MSNPNYDNRYTKPADVDAKIATQAATDAGQYPRREVLVSMYSNPPMGGFGTSYQTSGFTFRTSHTLVRSISTARLVIPWGYSLSGSIPAEGAAPSSVSVKASLEYNGNFFQLFFHGARTLTIDPFGSLVSDPIAIDATAGSVVSARIYLNVPNGGPYPNGVIGGPGAITTGDGYTANNDVTDSVAAVATTQPGQFAPSILLGTPLVGQALTGVVAYGDSITLGTGDSSSGSSYLTRAINGSIPLLRLAVGGQVAWGIAAKYAQSNTWADRATSAVVFLGTNDLPNQANGNQTDTQLKASLASLYAKLRGRGLKVYGCTLPPRTSSTDSWATTTNQTPVGNYGPSSYRTSVNTWIRNGGGGLLTGFFDTADTVESARDSGVWKAGYTTDGLHPNATGHAAMALAINVSLLNS